MGCVIRTSATCITPATVAPLDVAYAKLHLRAISDYEDELVESWIHAAASYFEEQTGRPIMRAVFEYWLDAFPVETAIELPHPPLVDVQAVEYLDSDGALTAFTDGASPASDLWLVRKPEGVYARRGWVLPAVGQVWPYAQTVPGAVRIRYEAGYADTQSDVPHLVKLALLHLVGQFDQFRSNLFEGSVTPIPFGADAMIAAFKYSAYPSQVLHRP